MKPLLSTLFVLFTLASSAHPCIPVPDTLPIGDTNHVGMIFTKAETAPSFINGNIAWQQVTDSALAANRQILLADGLRSVGTCLVQFRVNYYGNVYDVQALTMQESELAKVAVALVRAYPL